MLGYIPARNNTSCINKCVHVYVNICLLCKSYTVCVYIHIYGPYHGGKGNRNVEQRASIFYVCIECLYIIHIFYVCIY